VTDCLHATRNIRIEEDLIDQGRYLGNVLSCAPVGECAASLDQIDFQEAICGDPTGSYFP